MIQFAFKLYPYDDGVISPVEMGHIDVSDGDIVITSRNKKPDQSMMLFLTLSNLLDVVRNIILSKFSKKATFSSVDSSFELYFKVNNQDVYVMGSSQMIKSTKHDIADSLYMAAFEFYTKYSLSLENEHNFYDIRDSLLEFKDLINAK